MATSIAVAPLAGAWIETGNLADVIAEEMESHPSRVRGLKLAFDEATPLTPKSRTPRGCVD